MTETYLCTESQYPSRVKSVALSLKCDACPNWLIPADRDPRGRGSRPLNSHR